MLPLLPNMFRVRNDRYSEIWGGKRRLFDIMENFSVQSVLQRRDRSRAGKVLLSPGEIYCKPTYRQGGELCRVLSETAFSEKVSAAVAVKIHKDSSVEQHTERT